MVWNSVLNGRRNEVGVAILFLKDDRASDPITVNVLGLDDDEAFGGIRCPLCN